MPISVCFSLLPHQVWLDRCCPRGSFRPPSTNRLSLFHIRYGLLLDFFAWVVSYLSVSILLFGLILLYQFTPLKIEWIGLVVIGIYACIYYLLLQKRDALKVLLNTSEKEGQLDYV